MEGKQICNKVRKSVLYSIIFRSGVSKKLFFTSWNTWWRWICRKWPFLTEHLKHVCYVFETDSSKTEQVFGILFDWAGKIISVNIHVPWHTSFYRLHRIMRAVIAISKRCCSHTSKHLFNMAAVATKNRLVCGKLMARQILIWFDPH